MPNLYGSQNFRFDETTEGVYVYTVNSDSGTAPNGDIVPAKSSSDGDLSVDIHGPSHPFGSIHVETAGMVFQTDAVYGISSNQINQEVGHLTGGVSSATNTVQTLNTREDQ